VFSASFVHPHIDYSRTVTPISVKSSHA
jgi:hypothetical protein